jgi:hypothetical protein
MIIDQNVPEVIKSPCKQEFCVLYIQDIRLWESIPEQVTSGFWVCETFPNPLSFSDSQFVRSRYSCMLMMLFVLVMPFVLVTIFEVGIGRTATWNRVGFRVEGLFNL